MFEYGGEAADLDVASDVGLHDAECRRSKKIWLSWYSPLGKQDHLRRVLHTKHAREPITRLEKLDCVYTFLGDFDVCEALDLSY